MEELICKYTLNEVEYWVIREATDLGIEVFRARKLAFRDDRYWVKDQLSYTPFYKPPTVNN